MTTKTEKIKKEQERKMAKWLHDLGYIYALYGALDGLSLSYSTLKYLFDVLLANSSKSSSDVMHDWMLSPWGIAITAVESISIIVFSMLANHFDEKDKNLFKRYIVVLWPYIRDVMKGLKNAYKGVKTTFQVADMIGGVNLNFLMVPFGLALGGLSVLNRLWFRYMLSLRKTMMKENALSLAKINKAESLSAQECAKYRNEICKQTQLTKTAALLSAAYSGMVDSLYLYVGVLSLCSFVWPALIAMTVFCVIYSICGIATRVYEEYDFQRKLLITQAKLDLAIYSKENSLQMQDSFTRLQEISNIISVTGENKNLLEEQYILAQEIKEKIKLFSEKRAHLQSLMTLSTLSAFLAGVKNGLAAYGALTSVMFALATLLILTSTPFPPFLLITFTVGISTGLLLIVVFAAISMISNYFHEKKKKTEAKEPHDKLWDLLQGFKDIKENPMPENLEVEVKTIIGKGMAVDPSPQFFFQEWFEVVRSFFSGLGKGSKSVDYTMNPLQEIDDKTGHYHDTPFMMVVALLASLVYGISLALRAYTRAFGRPPIDEAKLAVETSDVGVFEDEIDGSIEPEDCHNPVNTNTKSSIANSEVSIVKPALSRSEESGRAECRPGSGVKPLRSSPLSNLSFFKSSSSASFFTKEQNHINPENFDSRNLVQSRTRSF